MAGTKRRDFLTGSTLAAGWVALSAGMARAGAPPPHPATGAGDPPGDESSGAGIPPTARFLDAAARGDLEALRTMLGGDSGLIFARDPSGRSAFAIALLGGHVEAAGLLRARGYLPDLHESALAIDWERFEALAGQSPGLVNQDHPLGGTAMFAAATGGAGSQIWRVFRFGGDPDICPRGESAHSALRAAFDFPDLGVAEMTAASLLANGADPNMPQAGWSSPLHAAAVRGSIALTEILIRKGARIDAPDAAGRTALELAETNRHPDVARLLREERQIPRDHSTSRDAYDLEGRPYTAPDLAVFALLERERIVGASHAQLETVRGAVDLHPLLAHSVATTTERAVEAGAHMGQVPIVDYLLDQGAPYSLPTAVMRNDLQRVAALLDEDPLRIHERGAHDFALLWYPVIGRGLVEMADLLLQRGASVERQHWLGTTALHFAALGGQTDMLALLIDRGGDVNRVGRKFDPGGQTPLQLAVARDHTDAARLLRDRGARG